MTAARKPCVPKRDTYFDEDQFVAGNKAHVRGDGEEAVRARWRAHVENGTLPSRCPICGFHHWPEGSERAR